MVACHFSLPPTGVEAAAAATCSACPNTKWKHLPKINVNYFCSDDQHGEAAGGSVTNVSVEVLRLDHGDEASVSLRNVCYLTQDMAALPLQALQVSLAGVSHPPSVYWKLASRASAVFDHRATEMLYLYRGSVHKCSQTLRTSCVSNGNVGRVPVASCGLLTCPLSCHVYNQMTDFLYA